MKFNINDDVRVRLTDTGRKQLEANHNKLFASYSPRPPYIPPKEDENGWSTWQLWELMAELGRSCWNGGSVPFETEIDIVIPLPESVEPLPESVETLRDLRDTPL